MDCWRTYLHMPKSVITFVFKVLRNGLCFRRFRVFAVFAFSFFPVSALGVFAFSRFRVPPAAPPRPGHRFRVHSILTPQNWRFWEPIHLCGIRVQTLPLDGLMILRVFFKKSLLVPCLKLAANAPKHGGSPIGISLFLFQWSIFRCEMAVSFREGSFYTPTVPLSGIRVY